MNEVKFYKNEFDVEHIWDTRDLDSSPRNYAEIYNDDNLVGLISVDVNEDCSYFDVSLQRFNLDDDGDIIDSEFLRRETFSRYDVDNVDNVEAKIIAICEKFYNEIDVKDFE